MYYAGVDIGSITSKAVILDNDKMMSTSLTRTGHDSRNAGRKVFEEALEKAGLSEDQLERVIATGYGRLNVDFTEEKVTEITCHAKGAHFSMPDVRTVIDLGGQDSKGIAISKEGKVIDFVMNDKCAAGTGRFLEVMAAALQIELGDLGKISRESDDPAPISSVCTVFAESEVISRVAEGVPKKDIIAGIHRAIASRIFAMVSRIPVNEKVVMTGGVAKNTGVVDALEDRFGTEIEIPEMPQHMGSLGAAIIARERSRES